jgi:hypothetical protein
MRSGIANTVEVGYRPIQNMHTSRRGIALSMQPDLKEDRRWQRWSLQVARDLLDLTS